MRARLRLVACLLAAATVVACSSPLGRQYEYDEQTYLAVDGSATVVVNSSLPALVALRGANIDPRVDGSADRDAIRQMYESAGCTVDRVGRFWYRRGRRFVQVQVSTNDIRTLSTCALVAWSAYALGPDDESPDGLRFRQTVSRPAGKDPGTVNWDGSELIAFKLHAPSKIRFHNVKKLDGTDGSHERGNILTWEQTLADRRAGKPLDMAVRMDATSILFTTIWLFVGAFAAAVLVLVVLIWLTVRRGRKATL
jgi:hypothetical protein